MHFEAVYTSSLLITYDVLERVSTLWLPCWFDDRENFEFVASSCDSLWFAVGFDTDVVCSQRWIMVCLRSAMTHSVNAPKQQLQD